ncbi:MAG: molybdenum cofactor guanylyltransferase MobA [Gammaproteobacteria bacterium]|nr:molybdenum cofactor guanylyltransferase MobA [Gammaproteobacteria bacterium]
MSITTADITAVILAGGQGRRMGGEDKGLLDYRGRPLVATLIDKLQQQSVAILINANRNPAQYAAYGYPVVADRLDDYQGPLAGFASAMTAVDTRFILTLPCDAPLLAADYVARFSAAQAAADAGIVVAHDGERLQPVHALIRVDLLPDLQRYLTAGERKIDRWYARHDYRVVDFADRAEMFRNINTPADQQALDSTP